MQSRQGQGQSQTDRLEKIRVPHLQMEPVEYIHRECKVERASGTGPVLDTCTKKGKRGWMTVGQCLCWRVPASLKLRDVFYSLASFWGVGTAWPEEARSWHGGEWKMAQRSSSHASCPLVFREAHRAFCQGSDQLWLKPLPPCMVAKAPWQSHALTVVEHR